MRKKAVTLLEILVAMIILSIGITGLVSIFVSGKRYIQKSKLGMSGGELGKYFLDPLQNHVNQATWSSNPLGSKSASAETVTIDSKDYKGEYAINTDGLPNNLTRVKVTITLPDLH